MIDIGQNIISSEANISKTGSYYFEPIAASKSAKYPGDILNCFDNSVLFFGVLMEKKCDVSGNIFAKICLLI